MMCYKKYFLIYLLFFLTIFIYTHESFAAETEGLKHLEEMPRPEQIMADIQGSDELDTAARQYAAMSILIDIVTSLSPRKPNQGSNIWLSPEEKKLNGQYSKTQSKISSSALSIVNPTGEAFPEQYKWYELGNQYAWQDEDDFMQKLLERYFSDQLQTKYLDIYAPRKARMEEYETARKEQEEARKAQEEALEEARQEQERQIARRNATGLTAIKYLMAENKVLTGLGIIYIIVLIGLVIFSFRGRYELDPVDPRKLHAGNTYYELYSVTGEVLNPTKNLEVRTHVSGGGTSSDGSSSSISTSHTTIEHLQFFIKEANGDERAIQVTDLYLALREGHDLSGLWMIKKGESRGPYFLFLNHSTGRSCYVNSALKKALSPNKWLRRGIIFLTLPALLIPVIPFEIVFDRMMSRRVQRVKNQIDERLVPKLDAK